MAGDYACPVCKETKLSGIHGGVNGGRACWTSPTPSAEAALRGPLAINSATAWNVIFIRW